MPELPEVETVVRELRPQLVGRAFAGASIYWPRTLATPDAETLADRLTGSTVVEVGRRGKHVLILLDSGDTLIVHLRMTGNLTIVPCDDPAATNAHVRAGFDLAGGDRLVFTDMRKFGRIWLVDDTSRVIGRLGPEPLAWDFTAEVLAARLHRRRTAIKALLLDQTAVAGIGNIYADEALFRAGIHPLRNSATLTDAEITALHAALQAVLNESIDKNGTLLRDYRTPYGTEGAFREQLRVYQQTGNPCPRCGTAIERIRVTQRSTHFCPQCQPCAPQHLPPVPP